MCFAISVLCVYRLPNAFRHMRHAKFTHKTHNEHKPANYYEPMPRLTEPWQDAAALYLYGLDMYLLDIFVNVHRWIPFPLPFASSIHFSIFLGMIHAKWNRQSFGSCLLFAIYASTFWISATWFGTFFFLYV